MKKWSSAIGLLVVILSVAVWQRWQTDNKIEQLESQLLTQHEEVTPRMRSLVGQELDQNQETSDAQLPALQATIVELREQVEAQRGELDQLKQVGETVRSGMNPFIGSMGLRGRVEHWTGGPKRSWGHEQAAGEPNTPRAGDISTAWAPKAQDGGEEWLQLDYEDAVDVSQINVIESHNPGAISKVTAIGEDGQEVVVWEGAMDPSETDELITSEFPVSQAVRANQLKVYLDTRRVSGWNEIDAVELVGENGRKQWAIGSSASSSFSD
ncbi:MAG: hypothetical protein AAF591_23785 [Verrucomicrobiota bacterium]